MLEQVGKVSYKLQLLDTTKIHSVFHVPLFKKVVGSYSMEEPLPLSLSNDETISVIVSKHKTLNAQADIAAAGKVPGTRCTWRRKETK